LIKINNLIKLDKINNLIFFIMKKFIELYQFLEFAKNNRKYPESTANNLKSAIKIFEAVLNEDELASLDLVVERLDEIFFSVISRNKDKSITSLNTYKTRLQRVLEDYKKYGADPSQIQNWYISTPRLITKDKPDKLSDKPLSDLSSPTHTPVNNVHKLEFIVQKNSRIEILLSEGNKEITLRILQLDSPE